MQAIHKHSLKLLICGVIGSGIIGTQAQISGLGGWASDESGLPCFRYTGALPFAATQSDGTAVKLPNDPWFILGNQRLTLFAHVSGTFQLISGERTWARLNQDEKINSGWNSAQIKLTGATGRTVELTGLQSLAANPAHCRRIFGCGYARYEYDDPELSCTRTMAVKPSTSPKEGNSAFLISVTISNKTSRVLNLDYTEAVGVHFQPIQQQYEPVEVQTVRYANSYSVDEPRQLVLANIKASAKDPLLFLTETSMSAYDGYPPTLFLKCAGGKGKVAGGQDAAGRDVVSGNFHLQLSPGQSETFQIIVGFAYNASMDTAEAQCADLLSAAPKLGAAWKAVLPAFASEQDQSLRNELIWAAHTLEAMATYNSFYDETQIPQGTVYDYAWGVRASARDQFQHGLAACYYNPPLARSILRYMMKRITAWGEIRLTEIGYGSTTPLSFYTSDQQLYFFLMLSEYLRITKDYSILADQTEWYPVRGMTKASTLEKVVACFGFLRDEVGTGSHGLVRLLNADWNDNVFVALKEAYLQVLSTGESHMNTAMAIYVMGELDAQLALAQKDSTLAVEHSGIGKMRQSFQLYRGRLLDAFRKDLGDRVFPRRMYFAGRMYGETNMYLEPQGYTLLIPEFDSKFKARLHAEMKSRLMKGERLAARQVESPEFDSPDTPKGCRENGGFWWSLNGPVVMGLATFDLAAAHEHLKRMTLHHLSQCYPGYWTSYWSASDSVDSSLLPSQGLPGKLANPIPVFCAHPHAWVLYCYYHLNEQSTK